MTQYTTGFAEDAWAAVQAHATHIAVDQQSPVNSARWLARVLDAVRTLQFMPERFAVDQRQSADLGHEVRRLVFERTYLLFYAIDDVRQHVNVVVFRHGARRGP